MQFFEQERKLGIIFSETESEYALNLIDCVIDQQKIKLSEEAKTWLELKKAENIPLTKAIN